MATLQEIVNTAYLQALGRPADPDGLKHYVAQLESGKRVDGRRIGIGDILADLNYAVVTGKENKAANQAITARGGWDFAPAVDVALLLLLMLLLLLLPSPSPCSCGH
jgi:hypothetical protein